MKRKFILRLYGVFQLLNANGEEIILGKKCQGLLAILVFANGRQKARATLQDLLWSDRGEYHGRDSLKKAISSIKRAIGDSDGTIIQSKGGPVKLNLDAFEIDVLAKPTKLADQNNSEFLEGIQIKDDQFEAWLRQTRSMLLDQTHLKKHFSLHEGGFQKRISIGIYNYQDVTDNKSTSIVSELLLSRVILALSQLEMFDVFDFREVSDIARKSTDLSLVLRAADIAKSSMLSFSMRRISDDSIVWGQNYSFQHDKLSDSVLRNAVVQAVDQIATIALKSDIFGKQESHFAAKYAMDGINQMFQLTNENLENSSISFKRAIEIEPRSSFYAWFAYLSAFRLENSKESQLIELREKADSISQSALELDHYNPITRSLLSHVYNFVFNDFSRGESLLSPLAASPPDNPMYFHSLALLNFYTGRYSQAKSFATQARKIGKFHPFAYAFSTSLCMIELMQGSYSSSILYGEEACSARGPKLEQYGPTQRYLTAAYSLAGDNDNASRYLESMEENCIEKLVKGIADESFLIPSTEARNKLRDGINAIRRIH